MWGVNFINVPYFFAHTYGVAGSVDFSFLPPWILFTVETIYIIGMCATLILLILIVYSQIRLVMVEHEGFHASEEHDYVVQTAPEGVNVTATEIERNDRWDTIVELSQSASQSDWRRAILEADIMLFDVLGDQGYPGDTVGERLKHANPMQMTTLRPAWNAHMLRNKIAHGGESFELTERDVRTAINQYKSVFEEFGAI